MSCGQATDLKEEPPQPECCLQYTPSVQIKSHLFFFVFLIWLLDRIVIFLLEVLVGCATQYLNAKQLSDVGSLLKMLFLMKDLYTTSPLEK